MELTRSDCFPLFLLSSQGVTPKAVPVAYVQRSRIRLATTPSQQATAIDTPLDPTTAVSPDQNHFLSPLSPQCGASCHAPSESADGFSLLWRRSDPHCMSAHANWCAVVPQNQNHSTATSTSADIEGNGCQCTLSVKQADEHSRRRFASPTNMYVREHVYSVLLPCYSMFYKRGSLSN
jgi:hypothetical protein